MEPKEVQEYFKNAKEVRCLADELVYDLTKIKITRDIHEYDGKFWINAGLIAGYIQLTFGNKFAEIISYKTEEGIINDYNKLFSVTKEQLRSLTDPKVKEMFPEAFEDPTFEYLEEVEVSFQSNFKSSTTALYGCKTPSERYICFSKDNKNYFAINYIKKLK